MTDERIRVVVADPGPGGRDGGPGPVARALRDAGMEVVHAGPEQEPERLVATVVQEDADAVGLGLTAGAPVASLARIAALLRERGADDVLVFGGGEPQEPAPAGVARVFPPGAPPAEVVTWVRERLGG